MLCASMAEGGVPLADPADRPPKCSIATAANGEGTSPAKKSTSLSIASSLKERKNPLFQ